MSCRASKFTFCIVRGFSRTAMHNPLTPFNKLPPLNTVALRYQHFVRLGIPKNSLIKHQNSLGSIALRGGFLLELNPSPLCDPNYMAFVSDCTERKKVISAILPLNKAIFLFRKACTNFALNHLSNWT